MMNLDPAIRDWVLFPIMTVMILIGILRHYATILLATSPKLTIKGIRENAALAKSRILRSLGGHFIPRAGYESRQSFLTLAFDQGKYLKGGEAVNPMDAAGMEAMTGMLKNNMMMLIPQTIIMSWITTFFSGFVVIKLPFPLTIRFKSMLQRGILTPDMDVSWVSSLSWYFLNLFGLKSIYTLILGDSNSAGGVQDMQQMAAMPQNPLQQPNEVEKIFKNEKELLDLTAHLWKLENADIQLLQKYHRLPEDMDTEKKNA